MSGNKRVDQTHSDFKKACLDAERILETKLQRKNYNSTTRDTLADAILDIVGKTGGSYANLPIKRGGGIKRRVRNAT